MKRWNESLQTDYRPYQERGWDPVAYQWEEVSFAVRPPQITSTVVVAVAWVELKFSAELIDTADAIAPTLAIRLDGINCDGA